MIQELFQKSGNKKDTYPSLLLKKVVVFPTEKISLILEGEEITKAITLAHKDTHQIVLLFKKNGHPSAIGVLAKVTNHWELAPNIIGFIVEGQKRVEVTRDFTQDSAKMVEVKDLTTEEKKTTELEALSRNALDQFKRLIQVEGYAPLMLVEDLQKEDLSPEQVSDIISSALRVEFLEKINLLETLDVKKRLEVLNNKLANEMSIAKTEAKIQQNIEKELNKAQKEFLLRERLKAIEKELGIFEEQKQYQELEQKIKNAGIPPDPEKKVLAELQRLKQMPSLSAEAPYILTYLEWVSDLPWSKKSDTAVDLKKARKVLDEDHYGLEKPKERVLEYLAVEKLTHGKGRATILCFAGPPGTGKTSVGQSVARALGRKFVRISLGGIRDEAEIRGHRRTYVGALPGRIIQGMRNAGAKNPVFMLDEIDKIGMDFRGDPSAALLEALDPAQNNNFSDHYIEIPFDLSEVFFITTANILDPIPPALRDRMEVIEFPGYTEEEKFHIAKQFLLPRVLLFTGINPKEFDISDKSIRKIISRYTREAGVRELERKISEITRKVALKKAQGESNGQVKITDLNLTKYLGPEQFEITVKEEKDEVGVATALAWTPVGGEIIFIESSLTPGKGHLTLTGQLGEVMQESAKAALTYVRSKYKELGFDKNFYYNSDVHVHVPSGAIPKDGPSAGIAIATSLASMITRKKVKKDVALSGEVTLSGKVMEVGGIKEKVLAAHRGGVKTIVLPEGNEKNLSDIPQIVRKQIKLKFVKHMDEALQYALK